MTVLRKSSPNWRNKGNVTGPTPSTPLRAGSFATYAKGLGTLVDGLLPREGKGAPPASPTAEICQGVVGKPLPMRI